MKYCKKCGAELPESAVFCEKCGNPVGGMQKQGNGKKKWILAISSGVIILAVATVGVLFAMGVIGGKDDVVQTDADVTVPQGVSSVTGEAVSNTEELEGNKQKDALENSNSEDMEWEAFQAYKAYMDAKISAALEESNADYEYSDDSYMDMEEYLQGFGYYYALIYLDSDNYPEMVTSWKGAKSGTSLYTYKNGNVVETDISLTGHIEYKEREGYVYSIFNESGSYFEVFSKMEDSYPYLTELYSNGGEYVSGIEESPAKGAGQIEKELGLKTQTEIWNEINWEDCCSTIDEAYTQLLGRNKSN